jgi:hypothetical protein
MKRLLSFLLLFAALSVPNFANAQSYAPVGPQTSVPVATVTGGGWTECYRETYAATGTTVASVLAACSGPNLMMACRATGSATLDLLAWAPKTDVTTDTGTTNVTHNANGSGWYFNDSWSWGFAALGDAISRNSCDTENSNPSTRLCWHTSYGAPGTIQAGYRCGGNSTFNTTFERILYTSNATPVPSLQPWAMLLMMVAMVGAGLALLRQRQKGLMGSF